ncbi:MAG: 3-isopropylmalate dehydratase, partial [Phycisphaeraceae bacterium]|nr:3-isopropylmalate dehydratase [Phycisphaeraceae bacterium]
FRNCVNGGFLIPLEATERLIDRIRTDDDCEIDLDHGRLIDHTTGESFELKELGDARPIIEAGGVFAYAKQQGMI